MLRLLIIDDEPLARQNLRQMLGLHPGLKVVGEADSVPEALRLIREEKPDAIFLDVQMPGADGFSLLRSLEHPPRVVFVTAHAAHAAEAFDFDAVDYLLKPVRPVRLAVAVGRLEAETAGGEPWQAKDRICFKTPERTLIATPGMIAALEADGDFTRIHIEGERPMLICHNLSFYEKTHPPPPVCEARPLPQDQRPPGEEDRGSALGTGSRKALSCGGGEGIPTWPRRSPPSA